MSDYDAVAYAKIIGTGYIRFEQADPLCLGLAAWWLKQRFQNKYFFFSQKNRCVANPPDGTSEVILGLSAYGKTKATSLHTEFSGNNNSYRDYITQRMRKGVVKTTAARIATFQGGEGVKSISSDWTDGVPNNAKTLVQTFEYIAHKNWSAIITFNTTTNGIAHAVALDSSLATPTYFDPNLGEFTFENIQLFCTWWSACYAKGREPQHSKSAFGMLGKTFLVEYFS